MDFIFFQLWLAIIIGFLIAGYISKKSFFYGVAGTLMLLMAATIEAEGVTLPQETSSRITEIDGSTSDVNHFYGNIKTIGNDGFLYWLRLVLFPVGIILLIVAAGIIVREVLQRARQSFG